MNGNRFGNVFKIRTYGESHGDFVGVYIKGCPKDTNISLDDIQIELDRRKPGTSIYTSPRKEPDELTVVSGIRNGKATGDTIHLRVKNVNVRSSDYSEILNKPRPGHADMTYYLKYGSIPIGGGRASGRETIGRVLAGAIARQMLLRRGIEIHGRIKKIHGKENEIEKEILHAKRDNDSVGGVIEIIATGVPAGIGEPVFDKLDADLAKALMSIGGVKGIEIGSGFQAAEMKGSEHNDPITFENDRLKTSSNNAGGILGGISTGMPIICKIAVKPTSSIGKEQNTVNISTQKSERIRITGRHDPCLCHRIVPVAESMVSLVLIDHLLRQQN